MKDNEGFIKDENNKKINSISQEIEPSIFPPIAGQTPKPETTKSIELLAKTDKELAQKIKRKIIKNVLLVGGSWILLFTAYQSIANLQSSLNSDSGLGTASLSTIYVALIVSSIFLPTTLMQKLGIKWTIVLSQCAFILYIAANMYARYYTLIPAAVILGLGAAPVWSAKCVFLTDLGTYYSKFSKDTAEVIINRFFGIFFAMFQSSNIWGNVISFTILKPENSSDIPHNFTRCGFHDCPGSSVIPHKPPMTTVYTLCGIYICLALLAVIGLSLFLDTYKQIGLELTDKVKSPWEMLLNTLKHIKNPNQILIIPLTLFSGFEQAFIGADFTHSYVSCIKGIENVGLVMICFGVADTLGSYGFGFVVKYIGRIPCFIIAATINLGTILLMVFWQPTEETTYLLYIIAVLWGLSDAVWQTQINAFYGVIFKSCEEAAFSNYRLWESLGFAIAYAYSNYLCTSVKLYLLIGYLVIGMLGFGAIEYRERKKNQIAITLR